MHIYISFTRTLLNFQNFIESNNYFHETQAIRTLIPINFMENVIIKTTDWKISLEQK